MTGPEPGAGVPAVDPGEQGGGLLAVLVEVLEAHQYRDLLGADDIAASHWHFGCTCGWERPIAGMSGERSWKAAHLAHVAAAVEAILRDAAAADARALDAVRALAEEWERRQPFGTMPNVRMQEVRRCAQQLRAVVARSLDGVGDV